MQKFLLTVLIALMPVVSAAADDGGDDETLQVPLRSKWGEFLLNVGGLPPDLAVVTVLEAQRIKTEVAPKDRAGQILVHRFIIDHFDLNLPSGMELNYTAGEYLDVHHQLDAAGLELFESLMMRYLTDYAKVQFADHQEFLRLDLHAFRDMLRALPTPLMPREDLAEFALSEITPAALHFDFGETLDMTFSIDRVLQDFFAVPLDREWDSLNNYRFGRKRKTKIQLDPLLHLLENSPHSGVELKALLAQPRRGFTFLAALDAFMRHRRPDDAVVFIDTKRFPLNVPVKLRNKRINEDTWAEIILEDWFRQRVAWQQGTFADSYAAKFGGSFGIKPIHVNSPHFIELPPESNYHSPKGMDVEVSWNKETKSLDLWWKRKIRSANDLTASFGLHEINNRFGMVPHIIHVARLCQDIMGKL